MTYLTTIAKTKNVLLGLVAAASLVIVNTAILKNVWNQAKSNAGFYQETIQEIIPDFKI
jgi:hypothetical protein